MPNFREPGFDDEPAGVQRGVWTTRPAATSRKTATTQPISEPQPLLKTQTVLLPPTAAPRHQAFRRILRATTAVVLILTLFVSALIFAYRWIAPPTTTLMLAQRFTGTKIERAWRPLEKISPHLTRAVIMSEDAGFCGHHGVDWKELERVYEQSLEGGSTGGGSTISMQVTKNLFLWPSKSYVRKAIEIPMTLVADRWWGKSRMLEIYLNIAEWGPGIFGAEAAARAYFKKTAADLNEAEAALLAVALPNPLSRNAADPAPRQKRMAGIIQGRMKAGSSNVRCLLRASQ